MDAFPTLCIVILTFIAITIALLHFQKPELALGIATVTLILIGIVTLFLGGPKPRRAIIQLKHPKPNKLWKEVPQVKQKKQDTKEKDRQLQKTRMAAVSNNIPQSTPIDPRYIQFQPGAAPNTWTPQVETSNAIAHVPNNVYLGYYLPPPPPRWTPQESSATPLPPQEVPPALRPTPETHDKQRPRQQQQYPGQAVWTLPEYPVEMPSREDTIANVVSGLPECCQTTPMQTIRNNGLYGIRGNVSCDLLKRSAISDYGFVQPIGARDAWIAYNTYDQLHAKDQFLVPASPSPTILHRQYPPLPHHVNP